MSHLTVEDNNGATYIRLTDLEDGRCHLEVGYTCSIILSKAGTPSEVAECLFEMICALPKDCDIQCIDE